MVALGKQLKAGGSEVEVLDCGVVAGTGVMVEVVKFICGTTGCRNSGSIT